MLKRVRSPIALAALLALSVAGSASEPVAASCIPLDQLLPDPAVPDAVVLVGTVAGSSEDRTNLLVDAWYLGTGAAEDIVVTGGRQPGVITSADWMPVPGERYVVVATRTPGGPFTTDLCKQAVATPDLVDALVARYGDPALPPFVGSPSPSSTPAASPATTSFPTTAASPSAGPFTSSPSAATSNDSPLPGSLVHGTPQP